MFIISLFIIVKSGKKNEVFLIGGDGKCVLCVVFGGSLGSIEVVMEVLRFKLVV